MNISGLCFDPTPGNNIVYFGAVQAAVTAACATNLVVTEPVSATYAPITVTVNGLTAYANQPFIPTFFGDGSGISASSFAPQLVLPVATGPTGPNCVVIADLDGDGKPDLAVINSGNDTISIYRNISTNGSLTASSFAPPVVWPIGAGYGWQIVAADLTGDGKLDLVFLYIESNMVGVLKNLCVPGSVTTKSFGPLVNFSVGSNPRGLAVRDLDGDGKPEIVTASYDNNTVCVLRNIGSNGTITTNSFAAPVYFPVGPGPGSLAIADLDGDGKPDIVTVNSLPWSLDGSASVSVLRNISTVENIAFASTVNLPGVPTSCHVEIGDVDGDGKLDLVVSSGVYGQAVSVYRNVSTPGSITTNSFAIHVDFAVDGWASDVAIGDLDGDGKPDLAVATQLPDNFFIFKNVSTPGSFTTNSFAPRVDLAAGYNPNGIAIGDLDGDGQPDIVFANTYDNTISIYQNQVPFGGPPVITSQPANQTVCVGGTASFSVTATGTPPLNYQWNFNGTNLAGATDATLTLTNVQLSQVGCYAVLVTNVYASILSSNAMLNLYYPFSYTTNAGAITITGYTGPGGAVFIPPIINNLPVTSVGDYAFYGCTSLTSVTIPSSVTSIGIRGVLRLHQPDQRHDSQQRHQHRRLCVR